MNSILNKYTKIFLLLIVLLVHEVLLAQVPQKMSFQAVIRDSNSALITSSIVNIKLSIIQGSENGTTVYSETHSTTTNANGLISIEIGSGSIQSGSFSAINWGTGNYYIKTETDPNGGSNYTIISSSQLLSVPYALYSANGPQGPAGTFPPGSNVGDMQYWNGTTWVMIPIGQPGQTLKIGENSIPQWSQSVLATVTTNSFNSISAYSASCQYEIVNSGGEAILSNGCCISTTPNPTLENRFFINSSNTLGLKNLQLGNTTDPLLLGTTYHVRAYVTTLAGTVYGNDIAFTTLNGIPTITTIPVSISQPCNIVTSGTNVTGGGLPILSYGVCYGTNPNPTAESVNDNFIIGSTVTLSNLLSNTLYYYRGFSTTNSGIFYGNELSFISPTTYNPNLVTTPVTISACNGISGSTTVALTCGGPISSRGICYSTSPNPTLLDYFVTGSTYTINNLTSNTQYYYRVYATNNLGTFYGNELSFVNNPQSAANISTYGASSINTSNAVLEGNIESAVTLNIVQKGFQISTSSNFTSETSSFSQASNNNIGYFASTVYFEYPLTTYYFRTYYKDNCSQYHYGNVSSFVSANISFTANAATQITSCSANITVNYFGGSSCVVNGTHGICYGTNPNPTIENNNTITLYPGNLLNLMANTTYYYRRYVTACNGITYYSNELSFTTLVSPSIITNPATNITRGTAQLNYLVVGNGVQEFNTKGFCYSTSPNPTISDQVIYNYGSDNSEIIDFLTSNTTYYVKSFMNNPTSGTCNNIVYGNEISFTTLGNNAPHVIGESFGGGVIFWVNATGNHGLIGATTSQGEAPWGCHTISIPTSSALGSGQANTNAIIAGCNSPGTAARICNDLILNGYSDWYLPSLAELSQFQNYGYFDINYGSSWSSTQDVAVFTQAYSTDGNDYKYVYKSVRAIRSF